MNNFISGRAKICSDIEAVLGAASSRTTGAATECLSTVLAIQVTRTYYLGVTLRSWEPQRLDK